VEVNILVMGKWKPLERTKLNTSVSVIRTSDTQDEENHSSADQWSSTLRANTRTIVTLTVVQIPPAESNLNRDTIRVGSDVPREAMAKMHITVAIQLLLVISLIRQARKIWTGVEMATCSQI
jgi:hypothetical protein